MIDYDLEVIIYRRPNLRSDRWMYLFEIGKGCLEDMFDHKKTLDIEELTLYFPERYLNLVEERLLLEYAIPECCPNMKKVEIHTQSVFIIQSTPEGHAFVAEEYVDLKNQSWGQEICVPLERR